MKVVYNFIYSDSDGKIQEFKMPVSITEEIDADTMYDLCLSYLEVGKVKGTPLHAISTSGKYPNYCFTSTACDAECEACRSKKLNGKSAQAYKPQSLKGKKIYIYEGKFGKVGAFSRRIIQKSYLLPAPALLTDNLIGDFKAAMNKEKDGMGWELLGITLVHELDPQGMTDKEIEQYVKTPEGNLFQPDSEEKLPEEKMIWARISDENENKTAWIPALVSGGKIYSAIGEINNPDSEEDTREFTDCPIPGYQISQTKITNELKTGFCVVTCLIKPKDTKIRPFLYRKEFHVPSEKEPIEYLKSLCSQFVIGDYDISIVQYQPISPLSVETLYSGAKCPDPEYNLIMKKYLRSKYFLVNYSYECNGTEIAATCLIPEPIFGFRNSYESISYVEEKLAKRVNYQMIISIHEYESILENWAVLL